MSAVYLDASAFVKLYLNEDAAEKAEVLRLVERPSSVVACAITYAEVRSVFARHFHAGQLSEEEHAEAAGAFEEDWATVSIVDVTPALSRRAGELLKAHQGLRGMDALHFAAALAARAVTDLRFLTFDAHLRRVVQALIPDALRD